MQAPRRRLKIVQVIARLNVGGAAGYTILLSGALQRRGHDVVLVNGCAEGREGELLEYIGADALGCRQVVVREMRRSVHPGEDVRALARLVALFRRERPDVVHTHTSKAGLLGRIAATVTRVPARVHSLHGTVFQGHFGSMGSRLLVGLERMLGRMTHLICTDTPSVRRQILAARIASDDRVAVAPLGLDLRAFRDVGRFTGALRARLRCPPEVPLVGMIARLVPVKNVGCLLAAVPAVLREVPEARFVVVGDGELRRALEERARSLGIAHRVSLVGFLPDLREAYADIDLLVLTSLSEGCPVAILEGMAAGVPVVASAVGGVPDVVCDGETGLLFGSDDIAGLAAAILRLLRGPQLATQLAETARARVFERFTIERSAATTERLYLRALGDYVAEVGQFLDSPLEDARVPPAWLG